MNLVKELEIEKPRVFSGFVDCILASVMGDVCLMIYKTLVLKISTGTSVEWKKKKMKAK